MLKHRDIFIAFRMYILHMHSFLMGFLIDSTLNVKLKQNEVIGERLQSKFSYRTLSQYRDHTVHNMFAKLFNAATHLYNAWLHVVYLRLPSDRNIDGCLWPQLRITSRNLSMFSNFLVHSRELQKITKSKTQNIKDKIQLASHKKNCIYLPLFSIQSSTIQCII